MLKMDTTSPRTRKKKDLTNKKFGRWTVLEFSHRDGSYYGWKCRCECGVVKIVRSVNLTMGRTKSCGCLSRELTIKRITTHRQTKTRLYRTWADMKKRCFYEKSKSYHNYGGRGITVCDEWLQFESFAKWAKQNGYTDYLQIDRIDVDGDYKPENCRFITKEENARNKRDTFKYKGELASEASLRLGGGDKLVWDRINRLGWDIEKAFNTPKKHESSKST